MIQMKRCARTHTIATILTLLTMFLAPRAGSAAEVKLFLKDGTYQLVKSYEVRGDRVRYYSIERSDWEEMPVSLVDFDATKRVQQEEADTQKKNLDTAREIDKQRFERPVATGFEVAPGIHLPTEEGVFAFDGVRVIRMVQTSAEVITDKKRAALRMALPGPLLKDRSVVVLDGPKAAVRILVAQPTFYINAADGSGARMDLLPVAVNKNKTARAVEKVQSGLGMGQSGETRTALPLERVQLAPGLYKLKPAQELAFGEYALGELIGEKLNLELWDFGIDGALDRNNPQGPSSTSDRPPVIRRKPPTPDPPEH
jgi:hypothetical protein